jgi:hypothetical protein
MFLAQRITPIFAKTSMIYIYIQTFTEQNEHLPFVLKALNERDFIIHLEDTSEVDQFPHPHETKVVCSDPELIISKNYPAPINQSDETCLKVHLKTTAFVLLKPIT